MDPQDVGLDQLDQSLDQRGDDGGLLDKMVRHLDKRMDHVLKRIDQLDKRVDRLDKRMVHPRQEGDQLEKEWTS